MWWTAPWSEDKRRDTRMTNTPLWGDKQPRYQLGMECEAWSGLGDFLILPTVSLWDGCQIGVEVVHYICIYSIILRITECVCT